MNRRIGLWFEIGRSAPRRLLSWLLVLGVVGVIPAGAQEAAPGPGFFIGLKGGLNVSTLSIDDAARPGLGAVRQRHFNAGANLQCGGIGRFTLQGEALYSRNGAKIQAEQGAADVQLDYLRVPVLFMARLSDMSRTHPILYAGPQLAFETRCQVAGEGGSVACQSDELEVPLDTHRVEFGLIVGGGLEIPLSAFVMQLDARYNLGLTNINGGTDAASASFKNRGWSFSVGVGRPFGRGR